MHEEMMQILQPTNGPPKDQRTRNLGPIVRICQINIEGISRPKSEFLSKMLLSNEIDLVVIQETHAADARQLESRGKIPGFDVLGATYHHAYGCATYVRNTVENAYHISSSTHDNIHSVVTKIGDIEVTNIYKPPNIAWPQQVIDPRPHPAVFIGDFNSHHQEWKYRANDENGEMLINWMEGNQLFHVFDAKDKGTFKSAAWKREYNPDLCFVTRDQDSKPLPTKRTVLNDFPHSQHRPVIYEIGTQIPLVTSIPRARWNFNKANWPAFTSDLDKCLRWIPPTHANYDRFTGAVISTAKKHIPRGYRREYIPGWSEESENLYQEFLESGDNDIADELLESLDEARREKWINTVESLDFKKSSREAWSLLRKLGDGKSTSRSTPKIHPNKIAAHIVTTSRGKREREFTKDIKKELRNLKANSPDESEYSQPFSTEEVSAAIKDIKTGKAPGQDGIHSEFLIHCGEFARAWLCRFYTDILRTGQLPKYFKQTKIIAILKQGKADDMPENYRPIALLSAAYKLLERLILNRIGPTLFQGIPVEQAGFRPERSTTDQVLSLTTYIEAGYQRKLKTSVAFVDLSAAYDTVWREGLIYKLLKAIPCRTTARLLNNMLSDRHFRVTIGSAESTQRTLNNGLPQGSVLSPVLFNLYISDMPGTESRRFGYADDWAIATRHKLVENTEEVLTDDLTELGEYFKRWRLKLNPNKTEVCCFHLNNKMANRELQVHIDNQLLRHNSYPKYLGVTLDRTLSFKKHLENTAAKLRTRNNIIHKLCGTTWGSTATTLRCSALGLVYSAAEYCAPVWMNSSHTKIIDTQLNTTMRLISGTIKTTPTQWLPLLSHIPPPDLRRQNALLREFQKILNNPRLPIHGDVNDANLNRLRSRSPPTRSAMDLRENNFRIIPQWQNVRNDRNNPIMKDMPCITETPPGFNLPRRTWTTLNRIRTGHGNCADFHHKWNRIPSAECECGAEKQTIHHITSECPLRKYEGSVSDFACVTQTSIDYMNKLDIRL